MKSQMWIRFIGKNTHGNICHWLVTKQSSMFDISTRLVSEQDEISGLETIGWENHSWKYLSLIGDERIINLQRTKVYVFSDSVLCLGKISKSGIKRSLEENDRMDHLFSKLLKLWRNWWWADKIRVEHLPRIWYVAALRQSQKFTEQIRRNTRKFHRKNSVHVDVQRHFLWNKRGKRSTRIFVCKKIW